MNISNLIHQIGQKLKENAPEILTALGVTGVISTAVLAAQAGQKADGMLSEQDPYMSNKEKIKITWKCYIPTAASGAFTIGCIVAGSKASGRRTAAAVTAYSLTERAFTEYKEKVVEQMGKGKEQKIRDEVAQDRVTANPSSKEVIIGTGEVLCCELYTKRYFKSNMESLRRAQNEINYQINNSPGINVYLEEFYDLVDLPYTSNSAHMGWDGDKLMELEFSTVLSDHGEPCLAFDYNYVKPFR